MKKALYPHWSKDFLVAASYFGILVSDWVMICNLYFHFADFLASDLVMTLMVECNSDSDWLPYATC